MAFPEAVLTVSNGLPRRLTIDGVEVPGVSGGAFRFEAGEMPRVIVEIPVGKFTCVFGDSAEQD